MDYLYHYTSIETLALIMSKRTIRFNCLKFVDDPEEKMASDVLDIGRLCLVSCWTDIEEESIPMWNMYTPNMKGIRLKMREYPFKQYPAMIKNAWSSLDSGEDNYHYDTLKNYKSYIDERKIAKENRAFVIPPAPELISVDYTNNESLIKPQLIFDNDSRFDITNIGNIKRDCWEFQSEWRYRIIFTPYNPKEIKNGYDYKKIKHSKRIPYKDYYLQLSDDAFEGAEIVVGPKASEAELIIVKSLVEKYQGKYIIPVSKSSLLIN